MAEGIPMNMSAQQNSLCMLSGTGFVAAYPDIVVTVLGMEFTNVQMLFWLEALGEISISIAVLLLAPVIIPDHGKKRA